MYNIPLSVLEFSKLESNHFEGNHKRMLTLKDTIIDFLFVTRCK